MDSMQRSTCDLIRNYECFLTMVSLLPSGNGQFSLETSQKSSKIMLCHSWRVDLTLLKKTQKYIMSKGEFQILLQCGIL